MKLTPLIFIVYDGVDNSVFQGQVVQPLVQQKQRTPLLPIHLVSYENKPQYDMVMRLSSFGINLIILPKNRWWLSAGSLRTVLEQFSAYELIARGPLAGFLALQAYNTKKCNRFIIQARGLLAEEYRYTHEHEKNIFMRVAHIIRALYFDSLERRVYRYAAHTTHCSVEAVSPALKDYIVKQHKADKTKITVAAADIPELISPEQIQTWRTATRTQLNIAHHTTVYCYNGSIKPWQCPELALSFFKEKLTNHSDSLLLLLTADIDLCKNLIKIYDIPSESYRILQVPHEHIYHYLAAADYGLLFRKPHIINWISRPTKVVEYQVVRLPIIHNDTVAYVSDCRASMRSNRS
jgi:hypothetical protein